MQLASHRLCFVQSLSLAQEGIVIQTNYTGNLLKNNFFAKLNFPSDYGTIALYSLLLRFFCFVYTLLRSLFQESYLNEPFPHCKLKLDLAFNNVKLRD